MKKPLVFAVSLVAFALTACTHLPASSTGADTPLHIVCTTYPVYLLTTAVTDGIEDTEVSLLVNAQTSCLHDYTLTVKDMKAIENADVVVMNGAGLEDFMQDTLLQTQKNSIVCASKIPLLLSAEEHSGSDHGEQADTRVWTSEEHDSANGDEEVDPHIWMSFENAGQMMRTVAHALAELDPEHESGYLANCEVACDHLSYHSFDLASLRGKPFITFHDGFRYFARDLGLNLLKSVEEEDGATVSAAELREIVKLIREYDVPAIFTEKNGSDSAARTIAAETGCQVYELDMLMSGEGTGIQPYLDGMSKNITTVLEALG